MALFERGFLEQDTGLLRERWDQEGSTYVTATDSFNFGTPSDQTVHTVTAGKVFYAKQLVLALESASVTVTIKDNGTALATIKPTETGFIWTFSTPLKFSTEAEWNCSGGNNTITLIGWEEAA